MRPTVEAVAREVATGHREPDAGASVLMQTRRRVLEGWTSVATMLGDSLGGG